MSLGPGGVQANDGSYDAVVSGDGRYVVFSSFASNLVAGDTNGFLDVFVRDRRTSVTRRVSIGAAGAQANGESFHPVISGDGRYVAFPSFASNLVAGDTNGFQDVFVRDRGTRVTRRVSVGLGGAQANDTSYEPAISADGRYVAFFSNATNLAAGDTNDTRVGVYVRDRKTQVTRRVSVGLGRPQANSDCHEPAISGDGRYVAFSSLASNLVAGDTNETCDVFVRDRTTQVTRRVSVGPGGAQANGGSGAPSISADGRYVAFYSNASNLVAGDTNETADVFVRDRKTQVTRRVSVGPGGAQANNVSCIPAISADGRYVAFYSIASNLVAGDTNESRRRVRAGPQDAGDPAGVGRSGRRPSQQRKLRRPDDLRARPVRGVLLVGVEPGGRGHQRLPGRVCAGPRLTRAGICSALWCPRARCQFSSSGSSRATQGVELPSNSHVSAGSADLPMRNRPDVAGPCCGLVGRGTGRRTTANSA